MQQHQENEKEEEKRLQTVLSEKIVINTRVKYMPQQAEASDNLFTWVYEVTVQNHSDRIVQLLNRFWRIVDMTGKVEDVRGSGVVGLQPIIKPSKEFVYTSVCQLQAPQGTMEGMFEFQDLDEVRFDVSIPKFILSAPSTMMHVFRSRLH